MRFVRAVRPTVSLHYWYCSLCPAYKGKSLNIPDWFVFSHLFSETIFFLYWGYDWTNKSLINAPIHHFISWQNYICSHVVILPNSWTLWLHDASTKSFDWHHNQITRFLALLFTDFLTLCSCLVLQLKTIFFFQN